MRPRLVAAVLLTTALGTAAHADEAAGEQLAAPLSEKEVLAAAPVIAADLRDARAAIGFAREWKESASKGLDDRQAVATAVREGRVDPLAWSRQRYPGLPLPDGFAYSAACSRKATADHPLFAVVVVLTSGVDSVDYSPERLARLKPEEVDRLMLTDTFLTEATRKRLNATGKYLGSRGLKVSHEHGFATFVAADGRLGGAVHDHNESCREMPTGPWVEMSVEPEPPPQAKEAPLALDGALRAAGLTEERYRDIVYRLARARHYAEHPDALTLAGGDSADTRDVELYSKLRGRLEPQLGELLQVQATPR